MKAWVTLKPGEAFKLQPGEYNQVLKKHLYGDEVWCNWRCPTCEANLSISRKAHTVNYLGELTPMVMCPRKCGFSHWVILDEWVPESEGSA